MTAEYSGIFLLRAVVTYNILSTCELHVNWFCSNICVDKIEFMVHFLPSAPWLEPCLKFRLFQPVQIRELYQLACQHKCMDWMNRPPSNKCLDSGIQSRPSVLYQCSVDAEWNCLCFKRNNYSSQTSSEWPDELIRKWVCNLLMCWMKAQNRT